MFRHCGAEMHQVVWGNLLNPRRVLVPVSSSLCRSSWNLSNWKMLLRSFGQGVGVSKSVVEWKLVILEFSLCVCGTCKICLYTCSSGLGSVNCVSSIYLQLKRSCLQFTCGMFLEKENRIAVWLIWKWALLPENCSVIVAEMVARFALFSAFGF